MAALTQAERTELEQNLAEAKKQLHRARMGKATSRIRHGDKDQTFVGANVGQLAQYVDSLKRQLGLPTGSSGAAPVRFG